jgi:hypothetical protein
MVPIVKKMEVAIRCASEPSSLGRATTPEDDEAAYKNNEYELNKKQLQCQRISYIF